jgi:hypothetical protein
MTSGEDVLGLGNETYSYSDTDANVSSSSRHSLTTNFADNPIGNGISNGAVYLKFFLNAPPGQAAGTYNNSVMFKAVSHGQSPG